MNIYKCRFCIYNPEPKGSDSWVCPIKYSIVRNGKPSCKQFKPNETKINEYIESIAKYIDPTPDLFQEE